ncbi:sigma-70 family RNA polymerase sigma factor [Jatrophihabitans cynanchi]|jgi:RNA polymerase sigma-70 factor (ECF subfamily)|uniref:Sigma-70 family RNA polymerase sigma factor n=1 Tax=Jatrophihabitans cynanchi TaxID=2944128 RepID=A0ABY7K077_9ACTN|nr:sigma-70 family RNA polymerase sigma factor [Jatrophihabitans sp. SB3-54]WAX58253.1 sigma-70 family RNA polymerase sigma factor [Jatrophihabitans sp. SB3-54]
MTLSQAPTSDELELHRRELTGYCYRMLGSAYDAEDAVQETMIRSWEASGRFEGRSSVRSWLYRIATNVCLDMLRGRKRRAAPVELGPACPPVEESLAGVLPEGSWVSPIADERVLPPESDPAELFERRESIRLAFVAALQHLPPRQRATLILCEVLRWQASEVAALLDTSVAAVNSALQRARATLADVQAGQPELDRDQSDLLARYVDAFERYDIDAFIELLHEDAIQSMPPFAMWLRGAADIGAWMRGVGAGCEGSRLITTSANGSPAAAQYRIDPQGGFRPWGLHVLDVSDGRICEIHTFLDDGRQFAQFGLPTHLPG